MLDTDRREEIVNTGETGLPVFVESILDWFLLKGIDVG
jgi:hypothetical protein